MSTKVVEAVIKGDTTDYPASTVMYWNDGMFEEESEVPPHSHLSMKTLLLGAEASDEDWHKCISSQPGLSKSNPDNGINIIYLPEDSVMAKEGFLMDRPGAEFTRILVHLVLKRQIAESDADKMENLWLRLKHILDKDVRGSRKDYADDVNVRKMIPGQIRATLVKEADRTIDHTKPYYAQFSGFIHTANVFEVGLVYQCNYIRRHPR